MIEKFQRPYDWPVIDEHTRTAGAAVLQEVIDVGRVKVLNRAIDEYLITQQTAGRPNTGSPAYDQFLGHNTIRLHGLAAKVAVSEALLVESEIVEWAGRALASRASGILLNAGELIQIQPGEPQQSAHRDSDSWPLPIGDDPFVVNAIYALDTFTLENGATWLAPASWKWNPDRRASSGDYVRAVMGEGDALIFRGDLIHRGGENKTALRRRAVSVSYCAGWLRPVENSFLNIDRGIAARLRPELQALLGYSTHENNNGGMVGLYENGNAHDFLRTWS